MKLYLLLELLVNGIQGVLDRHSFHVPCSDFESKREMKVNLLDRRSGKILLQHFLLVQCCRRGVELPKDILSALVNKVPLVQYRLVRARTVLFPILQQRLTSSASVFLSLSPNPFLPFLQMCQLNIRSHLPTETLNWDGCH